MVDLNSKIETLNRVGVTQARRLQRLEIFTIKDLLFHFPSRYEDLSQIVPISELSANAPKTIIVTIWEIKNIRTRGGKMLTKARVGDNSGLVDVVWFNQPYLTRNIKSGFKVSLSGKLGEFNSKPSLLSPECEILTSVKEATGTLHTGRIVPIYPETFGISSKWLRYKIDEILKKGINLEDYLPEVITIEESFPSLNEALKQIHFPSQIEEARKAAERLSFDELFLMQAKAHFYKKLWSTQAKTKPLKISDLDLEKFISGLPFNLTNSQRRVVEEIKKDLEKEVAMNRLLEGDVGSGKTVVAGIASFIAFVNKAQTIIMAPTEVLAIQHYNTLSHLFNSVGLETVLITGSKKPKNLDNSGDLIIGTHALLEEKVSFDKVGLLVIDEQHRFGVGQRAMLRSKTKTPHILTMTATPIPRTLALTLYGDLELSIIEEMPKDRLKVLTYVVPKEKRAAAYKFIEDKVKGGDQAFIICPLIEFSESLNTVKSAKEEFERLQKEVFPHLRLALLHGRLRSKAKEEILTDFKDKKYDILIATPVVEVGIDIPNATIMMVETADRFGLAALHQLRGRVGRGEKQSYCLLFTESDNPKIWQRLQILAKVSSGLKLAELDLKIRGSGQIYGTAQHGLIDLKIADITDLSLIEKTKKWFSKLLEVDQTLNRWPKLKEEAFKEKDLVSPD